MVSERKSFAAYAVTAALLLSSLPALIVAVPAAHAAIKSPGGGGGASSAHLSAIRGAALSTTNAITVTPNVVAYNATTSTVLSVTGVVTAATTTVIIQCSPADCPVTAAQSDANGNFATTENLFAGTPPGTINVSASVTNTVLASTLVTVTGPTATANPTSGPPGSTTTVTGIGFIAGQSTTVSCVPAADCAPVTSSLAAGPSGTVTATVTISPSAAPGAISLMACDSNGVCANAPFTVTAPALTVAPTAGVTGITNTVTVTGSGFVTNTGVTLNCVVAGTSTPACAPVTTNTGSGTFTAQLAISSTVPPGAVTISAIVAGTTQAVATFTVLPLPPVRSIVVTPNPTVPLATETVTGTAFTPNQAVTVTFTSPSGTTLPAAFVSAASNTNGSFVTTFFVPNGTTPGTATVTATGANGEVATTTVTIRTPSVTVTSPPNASGPPLTNIALAGAGFTANQPVTVTLGITGAVAVVTNTGTLAAGPDGSFTVPSGTASLMVPAGTPNGNYIIRAVDAAGLVATAPFTVTAGAGAATLTVTPLNGAACTGPSTSAPGVAPNQQVAALIGGFTSGELVNIAVGSSVVATATAGTNGVASVTFAFPQGTQGMTYTVTAVGSKSLLVGTAALYQCVAAQSATPNTLGVGQGTNVGGTGFGAGETVTETIYPQGTTPVTFGVGAPSPVVAAFTVTVGGNGQFTQLYTPTTFNVYTARSQGATTGIVATTTFTVTPPGLTVTSTPVYPCTSFVVSSTTGFSPTEVLQVTPAGGTTVTSTVNASGGFSASVVAPANTPPGNLVVSIKGISGTVTALQPITVPTAVLSATPNTGALNSATTVAGSGYIPNSGVNLALYFAGANGQLVPASAVTSTAPVTASANGTFTTSFMLNPQIQVLNGAYVISGTSTCSSQNTATTPVTITGLTSTGGVTPTANQPTTIYFAEGYTGRFATNARADFDEFISVLNPDNFTKTVTITYQLQGSSTPVVTSTQVGPNSDVLRSVNGDVGNDQIVSAIVSSNFRIAAERIINRTAPSGRLDSDSSLGNTAPGTTWYFAEGYTGVSFQEYLTVQNPGSVATLVTVTFLPQSVPAATPRTVSFSVPANSRATENIRRDYLPYSDKSVGMIVTSDQPVVAERVEYWGDGVGSAKFGAASKAGITGAAKQFFFAYGSDPGATAGNAGAAQQVNDESFVTVINPAPVVNGVPGSDATVLVSFFDKTGKPLGSKSITVSPGTRETVVVNNVIAPVSGPYYTVVSSDQPIFAEKPQYIGGSPNAGMHPGTSPSGSPAGLNAVLFPNVNTASASGSPISETVFLLNPGATAITVNGTYYTPNGQTVSVAYTIGAGQLVVVNVNADAGGLPAGPLGAQYTTGAGGQFVAARISNSPDQLSYIGNQGVFNQ